MTLVKIQSVFNFLSGSFIKKNLFLLLSNSYLLAISLLERLILFSVFLWSFFLRSYASSGLAFFPLVRHNFLFSQCTSFPSYLKSYCLVSCYSSAGALKAFSVSFFNSVYSLPLWLSYLRSYAPSGLAFFPLVRHNFISLFSPLCLCVLRASVVNNL